MPYYVYILRNSENKLYIGQTKDIHERLARHSAGQGALFVKTYEGFQLVYSEEFPTQLAAMRREKQLKGWTRIKKEALLVGNMELLKKL